jgi:hypothetical protein
MDRWARSNNDWGPPDFAGHRNVVRSDTLVNEAKVELLSRLLVSFSHMRLCFRSYTHLRHRNGIGQGIGALLVSYSGDHSCALTGGFMRGYMLLVRGR